MRNDVSARSRNPLNAGMTAVLPGATLALHHRPEPVAPPDFVLGIDWVFIPFAERKLEREFGEPGRTYRAGVRRWR